jgi:phage shock protein A
VALERRENDVAQTILGRIGQLVQANINAILDQAEDPEKMLDQLVRDYTKSIADAEEAVAQTVGNLRLAEDDQREALEASKEWGQKAIAASRKADEVRRSGSGADGGRFDELAKVALRRQLSYEEQARTQDSQITQQRELTEKLKQGLNKLRAKREELVSVMDPTSELNRFEERVRREEALARGREEVAISSLEEQFEQLESGEDEAEVEARFAQLKSGQPVGQLTRGRS